MLLRLKQFVLLGGDIVALFVGLYLAAAIRYQSLDVENKYIELVGPLGMLFVLAALIMFIIGLYDIGRARNTISFYKKIALSSLLWLGASVLFFYINPRSTIAPKTLLLLTTVIGFGIITIWRSCYNLFLSRRIWQTSVVFAGVTREVNELIRLFTDQPERGFYVIGCIGGELQTESLPLTNANKISTAANLENIVASAKRWPDLVVTAPSVAAGDTLRQELYHALFKQVSIMELAEFYESIFRRVPPFTFSENWFITHLEEQRKKMYDRARILIDFATALFVGACTIVSFPGIALGIKASSPGPIFFKQTRVGRSGRTFTIYKYRTMHALAPDGSAEVAGPEFAKDHDTRITKFGKFLRATRLDEWPQCLNILRGEMALIGPRPERPEFVDALTREMPFYSLRHLIKPGLTGWAQLQHSYYGDIEENLKKLEYDLYYVKNRGAWLDLAIILRTFNVLFRFIGR